MTTDSVPTGQADNGSMLKITDAAYLMSDRTTSNTAVNSVGLVSKPQQCNDLTPINVATEQTAITIQLPALASSTAIQPILGSMASTLFIVTYNAATGILNIIGSSLNATAGAYKVNDLSLKGDGGAQYSLSSSDTVSIGIPGSSINIQLSATDQLAVNGLLNHNGYNANDNTAYSLISSNGWVSNSFEFPQNTITYVVNATTPTLSGVSYNAADGVLTFSGNAIVNHGAVNGIALSDFSISGDGKSFAFSNNDLVSNLNNSGFTVTLSITDQAALSSIVAANNSNQALKLAATSGWDSDSGTAISNQTINLASTPVQILAATGLSNPKAIALDSAGNLYIADTGDNLIKEIAAGSHTLSTLTTSALTAPAGVTVYNGNVFISDTGAGLIYEQTPGNKSSTPLPLLANILPGYGGELFNDPTAITSYNGNLYFADKNSLTGNLYDIQEIIGGKTVSTLIANGLSNPKAIAFDTSGNLYIADGNTIKELSVGSHTLTTLLSNGLNNPQGLAVDNAGNLYIADSGNNSILELAAGSQTLSTILATGLSNPQDLVIDSNGDLYVADSGHNEIKEILHSSYLLDSPLKNLSPTSISNLWENTGQIELSKAVFTAFAGQSTVSAAEFSNTRNSDDLYYNAGSGGLYYDNNGSNVEIAVIGVNSHPTALSVGDFKLVN